MNLCNSLPCGGGQKPGSQSCLYCLHIGIFQGPLSFCLEVRGQQEDPCLPGLVGDTLEEQLAVCFDDWKQVQTGKDHVQMEARRAAARKQKEWM